jgi:hypothetical protein
MEEECRHMPSSIRNDPHRRRQVFPFVLSGELSNRFRKGSFKRGFLVIRAITKLRFLAYQHCSEAGAKLGISLKYLIYMY